MASPANDYEAARAARIAANQERMRAMGLDAMPRAMAAAAAIAATAAAPPRRPRGPRGPRASKPPAGAPRRSGRVAGLPPTDASGEAVTEITAAAIPAPVYNREVYGPAALAALGSVSDGAAWALFVDGYDGKNKKRVYDQSGGSTCHQCRQKVRATFTACGACGALKGVFCGDCLWMRYGEHVMQARARNENAAAAGGGGGGGGEGEGKGGAAATAAPSTSAPASATATPWACPPCRGLCNCSFHRAAVGLPPTGSLYRGALAAGFPSVAHFLVLSRLSPAGRAALAAAAGGPPPPASWLGAGPGSEGGSDDEDEAALATAAGLWARAVAAGTLGRGVLLAPAGEGQEPKAAATVPPEGGGGGGGGGT